MSLPWMRSPKADDTLQKTASSGDLQSKGMVKSPCLVLGVEGNGHRSLT